MQKRLVPTAYCILLTGIKTALKRPPQGSASAEYDSLPLPKQPEKAYLINLEAKVRSVLTFLSLEKEATL